MRIRSADIVPLRIPFSDGSEGVGLMPTRWTHLDMALVRLETEDGVVGWGDGFSYFCRTTLVACLRDMVLPHVVGAEIADIAAFNRDLQKRVHLQGRYGINLFAISAVDIALWDIAAKERGVSLATLLSADGGRGATRRTLPAYASLVRYGAPDQVAAFTAKAVGEGYPIVKLHEVALEAIEAGVAAADGAKVANDVNCNWSEEEAQRLLPEMKRLGLYWLEEPVFPPDDAARLGAFERAHGVSIASGENACTAVEFARLVPEIAFPQPSVTKVGGVSEFLAVCDLAEAAGKTIMPHAPYFGPGYWATAQLMAARPVCAAFEMLYIEAERWLSADIPLPERGEIVPPDRPGLGFEPDPDVIARYRVEA